MITIIDYQAGNLTSVLAAFQKLNIPAEITNDPQKVIHAERILFPGVGAAGKAIENLKKTQLGDAIHCFLEKQKPFLGICLGYQILFDYSEENSTPCLGILHGQVKQFSNIFKASNLALKIPHMGWNNVSVTQKNHPLWNNIPDSSEFYFVHSYYVDPTDKNDHNINCNYGIDFSAGTFHNHIAGVQFHPEKSGEIGLRLLQNFANWNPDTQ